MHPPSKTSPAYRKTGARGEESAPFGEKGRLGALITGAAVFAFSASNLYVCGLSLSLHQNLAAYFEVLDYVQIMPAWGLPALLISVGVAVYLFGLNFIPFLFSKKRLSESLIRRLQWVISVQGFYSYACALFT
jgi:hypothetical protein